MSFAKAVEFENEMLGKKRITTRVNAPADKAMIITLIIAQNILCDGLTVVDNHWLDYLW